VISRVWEATMEYCRSPYGVTSVSVRPYYATMLSRVYLALAMGFLVSFDVRAIWRSGLKSLKPFQRYFRGLKIKNGSRDVTIPFQMVCRP